MPASWSIPWAYQGSWRCSGAQGFLLVTDLGTAYHNAGATAMTLPWQQWKWNLSWGKGIVAVSIKTACVAQLRHFYQAWIEVRDHPLNINSTRLDIDSSFGGRRFWMQSFLYHKKLSDNPHLQQAQRPKFDQKNCSPVTKIEVMLMINILAWISKIKCASKPKWQECVWSYSK